MWGEAKKGYLCIRKVAEYIEHNHSSKPQSKLFKHITKLTLIFNYKLLNSNKNWWLGIPIFKYDNIKISYIKEGEGEPLVLIPGQAMNLNGYELTITFFKNKMTVIALDNRGTGKSSKAEIYTMELFVEDIKNLLDFLKIKEKIHLCGASMGGMIAQNFVLKYPDMVKSLILIATSARNQNIDFIIEASKQMDQFTSDQIFQGLASTMFTKGFIDKINEESNIVEFMSKFLENPKESPTFLKHAEAIAGHDTRKSIHEIVQPTLIMAGKTDQVLPLMHSKRLHRKIPKSRLEIFEGGHGFPLEEIEKVNDLMWDFIKNELG